MKLFRREGAKNPM